MKKTQNAVRDTIMNMARGFQPACVLIAGAELDVFTILTAKPMTAERVARQIRGDLRATCILLDALTALELLRKDTATPPAYHVPPSVARVLSDTGSECMLGMIRHLGNCLRRWSQLGHVVQRGKPAARHASVRGEAEDLASFIRAMHEISTPMALPLIRSLRPLHFAHLLDIGGASGTWTHAFLTLHPNARATIFDLPDVIPMARRFMKKTGLTRRVDFAAGNYNTDPLPEGADLAWVSAIVHQNSRAGNRAMYRRIFSALTPGGTILIRDIYVDSTRTRPAGGAMFAVNMLTATPLGGTFTLAEMREDLAAAGFIRTRYLRNTAGMDSVIAATRPVHPKRKPAPARQGKA